MGNDCYSGHAAMFSPSHLTLVASTFLFEGPPGLQGEARLHGQHFQFSIPSVCPAHSGTVKSNDRLFWWGFRKICREQVIPSTSF